jgi:hypothetical protein
MLIRKRVGAIVLIIVVIAVITYWYLHETENTYSGFPKIPGVSVADIMYESSFVATIDSKLLLNRKGYATPSGPQLVHDDSPYFIIYLVKQNGEELCLNSDNPSTNEIAFFHSLREGEQYNFPEVLTEWQVAHGTFR